MDIELRLLRHATALASEGSFAKAARSLHLSQPALSRSIQELERRAGSKLFERGREGALPTEVGRVFLRHAADVLSAAGDMSREMNMVKGLDVGELIVGVGTFPSELFMGEALAKLVKPGSSARIRLVHDQAPGILTRLRRREIDVGVADPGWLGDSADIKTIALSPHQGCAIVRSGHPLLSCRKVDLQDIASYPLITTAAAPSRLAALSQHGGRTGKTDGNLLSRWMPTIAVESVHMMKRIVAESDGVTLLSLHLVRHELARGELAVLPLPLPWLKVNFSVMHLVHRTLSPLGEAFVRALVEADRALWEREDALTRQAYGGAEGRGPARPGRGIRAPVPPERQKAASN